MSTGETVLVTIGLILGAGVTAGLWLNILMWIPMLVIGWTVRDEGSAFAVVSLLSMLVAAVVVFFVGLAINLPW